MYGRAAAAVRRNRLIFPDGAAVLRYPAEEGQFGTVVCKFYKIFIFLLQSDYNQ